MLFIGNHGFYALNNRAGLALPCGRGTALISAQP